MRKTATTQAGGTIPAQPGPRDATDATDVTDASAAARPPGRSAGSFRRRVT